MTATNRSQPKKGTPIDQDARSWVSVAAGSDFPIQNLPFGLIRLSGSTPTPAVRIGDFIVDLRALAHAELLGPADLPGSPDFLFSESLTPLMERGPATWRAVRNRVTALLRADGWERGGRRVAELALHPVGAVETLLPIEVGDFVDFYSSLEHAKNMSRIFGDRPPTFPNWVRMPVGFHQRASSLVVSGTPVVRPTGQLPPQEPDDEPRVAPTEQLDIECEVGFVVGVGNRGVPIDVSSAEEHIFGLLLVNDWSARDMQLWESRPLGPFLGKSFATTASGWIVSVDALEPFRVPGPEQNPVPPPYLRKGHAARAFNLELELRIQTSRPGPDTLVSKTNYRGIYWDMSQQLAHATSNGARVRPGDLFASGTISGLEAGTFGSMMELSLNGTKPIRLADGSSRGFIEDGDTVRISGRCTAPGAVSIGFGECQATIRAAGTPSDSEG